METYDADGLFIGTPTWNCFRDNTPVEVMTRQYRLGEFSITPTWNSGTHLEFNFPGDILSEPTVEAYLKPFYWLNAGVEISVQLNATVFHQGMMVSSFLHDSTIASISLENVELSAMNSVYYNYSTSQTAVLKYEWMAPVHGMNIQDPNEGAVIGKLILSPLVALFNAAGGDQTITVVVLARLIKPKVWGYRTVPGTVKKQSANSEEVAKTKDHSLFGPIGQATKGFLGVAQGVIGDLEDLGDLFTGGLLDKPTALDYPTKVYDDLGSEFVTGKGTSIATKLQMYPEFKLGDMPFKQKHFSSDETFRSLSRKPTVHEILDASSGGFTHTMGVTPDYLGNQNILPGGTTIIPDYLNYTASLHTYWRGSIKYHIKFVTSSMTQARIRISYMVEDVPSISGGDNPNMIIDIKGTTEVNLTVPYLWNEYMRVMGDPAKVNVPALYFSYLTSPVTSGATEPVITMVIFRAGGPDGIFALPRSRSGDPGVKGVFKQTSLQKTFEGNFPSFAATDTLARLKGVTITEQAGYISDLFKRYHEFVTSEIDPNLNIGERFIMQFPATYSAPGVFNPYLVFGSMFKYVRGGARFGYQALGTETTVNYITPSENSTNYNSGSGFYIQVPQKNRFSFVEMPYMCTSPYVCRTLNPNFQSVYNNVSFFSTIAGPADSVQYYMSFADDRQFFYLLPPPKVIIVQPPKKGIPPKKEKH